jgi:YD repeat-containing protein
VKYEYDNYVDDTRHKPLVLRASITGLDPAYSGVTSLLTARGNVTGVSSYLNPSAQTNPVTRSTQYDAAGNPVVSIDPIGNKTTFGYTDSFCNGVTCSGSYNPNTYAFVTSSTSPVPDPTGQYGSTTALVTSTSYEFWTGQVASSTDANNNTTTFQYNDPRDRLKTVIRPAGGGRTDFEYGDTVGNLFVRTLADLDASRRTDSYQYFDGLGRVKETRTYEDGINYIAVTQEYDALGRPFKQSNPYRPLQPENPVWSATVFDGLGRVKTLTTPDNAVVSTDYKGDRILVTDQAGKKRLSRTNSLGLLKDVWEITPNDPSQYPGIEAVTFGAQSFHGLLTHYDYSVLADLVKVAQGSQQRFFMYDSLKRLIRARNPEQSTNAGLALSDSITGNSGWSVGYQYDASGNLTQKTDARGVVSTYGYDGLNRNISVSYSDGTMAIGRAYDQTTNGKGRLSWAWECANANECGSVTSFNYDTMGRTADRHQQFWINGNWGPPYSVYRAYDLAGNVTSQTSIWTYGQLLIRFRRSHQQLQRQSGRRRAANLLIGDHLQFVGRPQQGKIRHAYAVALPQAAIQHSRTVVGRASGYRVGRQRFLESRSAAILL